jgi:hypothetical protein
VPPSESDVGFVVAIVVQVPVVANDARETSDMTTTAR